MPLNFTEIHRLAAPNLVNGRWRAPKMSRRAEWQDPPSMVKKPNPIREVPRRGNKHDRTKHLRIAQTKELLAGQQKLWAQQNKVRRDKLKEERDKEWDPLMEIFPEAFIKSPKPPPTEPEALELYHYKLLEAKQAKEKRWAELLKGGVEQKKKVSREERLAKKDEEKALKKEAKKEGKKPAVAAAAKGGKQPAAAPAKKTVQKKSKEAQSKAKEDKAKIEYAKMKAKKREKKK